MPRQFEKLEKPKRRSKKTNPATDFYMREVDYYDANFDLLIESIAARMKIAPREFLTMLARTRLSKGRTMVEAAFHFDRAMQHFRPNRRMNEYFEVLFWY
jgi:ribosomal protein S18